MTDTIQIEQRHIFKYQTSGNQSRSAAFVQSGLSSREQSGERAAQNKASPPAYNQPTNQNCVTIKFKKYNAVIKTTHSTKQLEHIPHNGILVPYPEANCVWW
jgi:hypothetical protein